jgi:predicted DNA-binding transcriptional regulator YafY
MPWGSEIEVLLETTLEEARLRIPAYTAQLREAPGGVIMRTQVDDMRMAARYLVGMGWRFAVVKPTELREEVQRLATELLDSAARMAPAP